VGFSLVRRRVPTLNGFVNANGPLGRCRFVGCSGPIDGNRFADERRLVSPFSSCPLLASTRHAMSRMVAMVSRG